MRNGYSRLTWSAFEVVPVLGLTGILAFAARTGAESQGGKVVVEDKDAFGRLRGLTRRSRVGAKTQPGDKSRVWGVNSFAALLMFGGAFCEDVAH